MVEAGGPWTYALAPGPAVSREIDAPVGAYFLDRHFSMRLDDTDMPQIDLEQVSTGDNVFEPYEKEEEGFKEYLRTRVDYEDSGKELEDMRRAVEHWGGDAQVRSADFVIKRNTLVQLLRADGSKYAWRLQAALQEDGRIYISGVPIERAIADAGGNGGGSVDRTDERVRFSGLCFQSKVTRGARGFTAGKHVAAVPLALSTEHEGEPIRLLVFSGVDATMAPGLPGKCPPTRDWVDMAVTRFTPSRRSPQEPFIVHNKAFAYILEMQAVGVPWLALGLRNEDGCLQHVGFWNTAMIEQSSPRAVAQDAKKAWQVLMPLLSWLKEHVKATHVLELRPGFRDIVLHRAEAATGGSAGPTPATGARHAGA